MTVQRLREVGEAGLIARLQQRLTRAPCAPAGRIVLGIGDDAALLQKLGPAAVVSADMLIEGVDFERHWASPRDVGHKAAAVNLSDLAAMGARPRGLLASVALHPDDAVADVLALLTKLHTTGAALGAPLVGGDISRTTGPWVIAVTALGEVKPAQALRRHKGRLGDLICVSGPLGAAAAGLVQLQGGGARTQALVRRQLRPTPRVALGQALAAAGCVRAAADISDGLVKDALHLAAPGFGIQLDVAAVPVARHVAAVAQATHLEGWQMALSGGEDFELVLAVARQAWPAAQACARAQGGRLYQVGRIVATPGLQLMGASKAAVLPGFDHFG